MSIRSQTIPENYEHISPAGAEVRLIMGNSTADLAHCTLRKGKISKAVTHKTVNEFWHVVSGAGAIWRRTGNQEEITTLEPGVTIDIPLGTEFQYRSTENSDLAFLCFTMPPWPGHDEVNYIKNGAWTPST